MNSNNKLDLNFIFNELIHSKVLELVLDGNKYSFYPMNTEKVESKNNIIYYNPKMVMKTYLKFGNFSDEDKRILILHPKIIKSNSDYGIVHEQLIIDSNHHIDIRLI